MYLGVDIGKKGGVALIDRHGELVTCFPMPDPFDLADKLENLRDSANLAQAVPPMRAFVELVSSMPRDGVKSAFTFGRGLGAIEGILIALKVPFKLVRPKIWQKTMFAGIDRRQYTSPKARALRAARELHPDETFIPPRCRTIHDGVVDAVLIAHYGKLVIGGICA